MPEAPKLSLVELRGLISDAGELAKGTQIADGAGLLNLARYENKLYCEAKGSGQAPYRVSLLFDEGKTDVKARCSCMAARSRPFCKHAAALLVSWARSPESFVVSEAPAVVVDPTAQKKKRIKTGKVSGADLMSQGVERVTTLVRELAVAGVAAAGVDRVEQVRQLGEALRENRLRRLSARTLELAQMLDGAISRRVQMDTVAYADLLSDMLLTARKLEKHLAGEALDDRYVEELIGKTWRGHGSHASRGSRSRGVCVHRAEDGRQLRDPREPLRRSPGAARTTARSRSFQRSWRSAPNRNGATLARS